MAIRQFSLQYSGGAGAEEHAYASGTVFVLGCVNCISEAVLFQSQLGKAIVAAIISGQIVAHAKIIQRLDFCDICFQIDIFE